MENNDFTITIEHNYQYYYDRCIHLLKNFVSNCKDPSFLNNWIQSVLQWQMAKHNIPKINFSYEQNIHCLGYAEKNGITLNIKYNKLKHPKNFVELTDTILHEFSHIKMAKQNESLKKDENGVLDGEYLPSFYNGSVENVLRKICEHDFSTSFECSQGMYYINENERHARLDARQQLEQLIKHGLEVCDNKTNKFLKKSLLEQQKIEKHINQFFKEFIHVQRDLQSFNKRKILQFQLDYPNQQHTDLLDNMFQTSRVMFKDDDVDQKTFAALIDAKDITAACNLLNDPGFKNTPQNLIDFFNLAYSINQNEEIVLSHFNQETIRKYSIKKPQKTTTNLPADLKQSPIEDSSIPSFVQ